MPFVSPLAFCARDKGQPAATARSMTNTVSRWPMTTAPAGNLRSNPVLPTRLLFRNDKIGFMAIST
jgi:hypothetical protein